MEKTVYTKKDIVRRASYKVNMSIDELKIIHDCFNLIFKIVLNYYGFFPVISFIV